MFFFSKGTSKQNSVTDRAQNLPSIKMRFIEVHEEDMDRYHLIKVDDIEEIEYSKDE